jgi:lipoate---protein ligase
LTSRPVPAPGHADAAPLFDVEPFRVLPHRYAVVRRVAHPTLVLGSTQPAGLIHRQRAADAGVEVVRRRGGGGAVLLLPGDHLWIEAWVPRGDPLWEADVTAATNWVGAWWAGALAGLGATRCVVHHGTAVPGRHGAVACFSGRGPGEVFQGERKVMGLSQWRSREGSLFHACAYSRWDPLPLVALLELEPPEQEALERDLARSAVGLADLHPAGVGVESLAQVLLTTFPTWE